MSQQRFEDIYRQKALMLGGYGLGGYSLGGMTLPPIDQLVAHYLDTMRPDLLEGSGALGQRCKKYYRKGNKEGKKPGSCKEYYTEKELKTAAVKKLLKERDAKEAKGKKPVSKTGKPLPRGERGTPKQKKAAKKSPWVCFLRMYSDVHGVSYSEALQDPQASADYKKWKKTKEYAKFMEDKECPIDAKKKKKVMSVAEGKKKKVVGKSPKKASPKKTTDTTTTMSKLKKKSPKKLEESESEAEELSDDDLADLFNIMR